MHKIFFSSISLVSTEMAKDDTTHLLLQVSLFSHDRDTRVVFDDKDWRHKSLGQLVRGNRFPGIRKTLSFSVVTISGVQN